MPKTPVDEAPAGPEMDAAVAEALGLEYERGHLGIHVFLEQEDPYETDDEYEARCLYRPSTDIAAAEVLWDKLAEDHWVVSVCYGPGRDGHNYASVQMQLDKFLAVDLMIRNPRDMNAKAETKPHAICRAFLKANGVEFMEMPE